jgi:hypothetical protein
MHYPGLGTRLKKCFADAGMKGIEIAKKLDIRPQTISKGTSNDRMSDENIDVIAELLNKAIEDKEITGDYLRYGSGSDKPPIDTEHLTKCVRAIEVGLEETGMKLHFSQMLHAAYVLYNETYDQDQKGD